MSIRSEARKLRKRSERDFPKFKSELDGRQFRMTIEAMPMVEAMRDPLWGRSEPRRCRAPTPQPRRSAAATAFLQRRIGVGQLQPLPERQVRRHARRRWFTLLPVVHLSLSISQPEGHTSGLSMTEESLGIGAELWCSDARKS